MPALAYSTGLAASYRSVVRYRLTSILQSIIAPDLSVLLRGKLTQWYGMWLQASQVYFSVYPTARRSGAIFPLTILLRIFLARRIRCGLSIGHKSSSVKTALETYDHASLCRPSVSGRDVRWPRRALLTAWRVSLSRSIRR